jgi:hypothetical protein
VLEWTAPSAPLRPGLGGCPHISKAYGNSRVTNFAGCGLVLVMVWVSLPGSHLESPDFMWDAGWAGVRGWPSMVSSRARSVMATTRTGPA